MKGSELIGALKGAFEAKNDVDLAKKLGVTQPNISLWSNKRPYVTTRQLVGLIQKVREAGRKEAYQTTIRPLVEFFPIKKTDSKRRCEVFGIKTDKGTEHLYRKDLKAELNTKYGIYIFFDSRGQALYIGQAADQTIWREMNFAFTRDRGYVQQIKRVRHPKRMQKYKTSDEKVRQITPHTVPLCELATYFSAYEVAPEMIDEIEALLVRSASNTVLNIKMEQFGAQKVARKKS
jgi:hypothetical protein